MNNKGLKECFPGTVVTKKSLALGKPNSDFIISAIRTSSLSQGHSGFNLLDLEIEGEFDQWTLSLKLELI
jgi:hypothetical protein